MRNYSELWISDITWTNNNNSDVFLALTIHITRLLFDNACGIKIFFVNIYSTILGTILILYCIA